LCYFRSHLYYRSVPIYWSAIKLDLETCIRKSELKGKSAVICGGSKGIGKETAKLFTKLGSNLCIIARDREELGKVQTECNVLKISSDQMIDVISCDCTNFNVLKRLLDDYVRDHGTPDFLLNVVGYAYPQYVEKLTLENCVNNYHVNYNGQLIPTLILLPYFMEAKRGHIVFVSSLLGFLGIMGYVAYSPSKFALVGLAECLRNELRPYNIKISILCPPDTDTPGFAEENKLKPKECALISEHAKLLHPETVSKAFVKGILQQKFMIFPGHVKLFWLAKRFLPQLIYRILDNDLIKARKKLGKN